MEIQITGKAIDLGDALQEHVRNELSAGVRKYFDRSAEGQVVFDKDGAMDAVEITVHLASGVFLAASDSAHDPYGAFDGALTKLEKRVRRYKRRLKDHHAQNRDPLPAEMADAYVLAAGSDEEADSDAPLVIAENKRAVRRMSVSDAVMQLELAEDNAVIFRNAKHGDLSVVYRRADGNIGWIDGGRMKD